MESSSQNCILIVGNTGTGKSTLCNYLCNSTDFNTSSARTSCTNACQMRFSAELNCSVIDTPGLRDTRDGTLLKYDRNTLTTEILKFVRANHATIGLVLILIEKLPRIRGDVDTDFLLSVITSLAMELKVVFACSNDEDPARVEEFYKGFKCEKLSWSAEQNSYNFHKGLFSILLQSPGINILWDEKICKECKKKACPRIPEECKSHVWIRKHDVKYKHLKGDKHGDINRNLHSENVKKFHPGHWGGFLKGWSCCHRGIGHTSYSKKGCTKKHECDSGCGDRCSNCNRGPKEPACIPCCTKCGATDLSTPGCIPYCNNGSCSNDSAPPCLDDCARCSLQQDSCLTMRSHTY